MKIEKLYRNKDWLNNIYLKEKLSTTKIAKICNVSDETIRCRLKKNNISCRSISESVHLAKTNHCNLSIEAINWIYGELLGDGCLQPISPFSARFQYLWNLRHDFIYSIIFSLGRENAGVPSHFLKLNSQR